MWPFSRKKPTLRLDRGDGPGERRDGWQSALSGVGMLAYDKRLAAMFTADPVDPTEAVELWRGNDLAARIVEALPDAMVREGFEIRIDGDEGDSKDMEKQVTAYWEDLDLVGHLWTALCYERAYGGGALLLGCNDLREMSQPLNVEGVVRFDWLHALEPLELKAIQWQTDPNLKDFGWPTTYLLNPVTIGGSKIMGVHVHASRLIVFPGIRVSRRQVTTIAGWGDATLTRCRGVLRDYSTAWDAAAVLMHDFAQAVYKIKGLSEIIAMDKDKELVNRIRAMEISRSVLRATVIDGDAEEFERKQTPLTGLPDLLDRFATRLAAAADMPATLLMGISPAGLNATGESDIRSWYDRVHAAQVRKMRPAIERVVRVIFSVLDIDEPDSWHIEFNPLWQPTEQEQAQARFTQAQTDKIMIDESVLAPDEVRQNRFGGAQYSFATQLNTALNPGVGPHGEPLMPSTGVETGQGGPSPGMPTGSPPYPPGDDTEKQTPVGPDVEAYKPTPGKQKVGPNTVISQTNDAWSEEARQAAAEARRKNAKGQKPMTREQRATQIARNASQRAHERGTSAAHVTAQGQHLKAADEHRRAGNAVEATAHKAQADYHAMIGRRSGPSKGESAHGGGHGGGGEHGGGHEGGGHGEGKGGHGKHGGHHEHGKEAGEGLEKIIEAGETAYGAVAGEKHDRIDARDGRWAVVTWDGVSLGEFDTEEEALDRLSYSSKRKSA